MQTKSSKVIVLMPNDSHLEVTYYCTDGKLKEIEKERLTQLFIQLHDCICTMKIEKSICKEGNELEKIVQNKVINERGHLC
ncbi:MAG: hypothetical protein ABI594_10500 [Ginsengibacter sp.]